MNDETLGRVMRERRFGILWIQDESLMLLLRDGLENGRAVRAVANGLPADARVIHTHFSFERGMWGVKLAHPDFSPTDEGCVILDLPDVTLETRVVPSGPPVLEVDARMWEIADIAKEHPANGYVLARTYVAALLTELGYEYAARILSRMPLPKFDADDVTETAP